ncbi:Kinesin-like protein KIN-14S [Linum grandiflorum]
MVHQDLELRNIFSDIKGYLLLTDLGDTTLFPEEVWKLLKYQNCIRVVGSTSANKQSSRSHCLLRVRAKGENLIEGKKTMSHLWLVGLAGSERVGKIEVEGERLKESPSINKTLSALGEAISALASKTSHIPYRNSKLTHMLKCPLGGDCKMFCSLNFAARVQQIKNHLRRPLLSVRFGFSS